MKPVGLLFDLYLAACGPPFLEPIPGAPPAAMFIPMLLFVPALVAELFAVAAELLFPATEPAPNRFGCRREFKMF